MKILTVATSVGVFAVLLEVIGRLIAINTFDRTIRMAGIFVSLFGVFILISAIRWIVVSKGRHPGWAMLGLLSLVGLIIAVYLKPLHADHHKV